MNFTRLDKSLLYLLKADTEENIIIKAKILKLDKKVQERLFLCCICIMWGYLIMIYMIVSMYKSYHGEHLLSLAGALITIYIFFGIYMFNVWKNLAYKNHGLTKASKAYLEYQISKLTGQRKLIMLYLIINASILAVASLFFYLDARQGIIELLKETALLSLMTYIL